MSVFLIFIGFILLVVGGEFLVRSSVSLSFKLKLSRMVIGLTVVSFATSAPELIVSIQAAFKGSPEVALGNIIGSNIANIGLVLGLTAIIIPMTIGRDFFRLNWPVMMFFSALFYFFLYRNGAITRIEGIIFVVLLIAYLFFLIKRGRGKAIEVAQEVDEKLSQVSNFKIVIWLLIGGVSLYFGAQFLVDGAVDLAEKLGVSKRVIAVTMVAIGTSIPELAASVISAIKGEKALSLGNLIGSNIFNIASVLGVASIIVPIPLTYKALLTEDLIWMIGISALLLPLGLISPTSKLSRYKGFLLFIVYLVFIYFVIV